MASIVYWIIFPLGDVIDAKVYGRSTNSNFRSKAELPMREEKTEELEHQISLIKSASNAGHSMWNSENQEPQEEIQTPADCPAVCNGGSYTRSWSKTFTDTRDAEATQNDEGSRTAKPTIVELQIQRAVTSFYLEFGL